jgi:SAM-dependent methyltransferase
MKSVLQNGAMYHLFQVAVGAFSARVSMMRRYLHLQAGQRVIDIGCGPGHILTKMPEGVIYDGFDMECDYIDFANQHFGNKGSFHCRLFDIDAVSEFGPADIVMMNGVLHHMDDDSARMTVSLIEKILKPGGTFFALDGVYTAGQGAIAKWFLDNDRGKFVRTEAAYRAIFLASFPSCEIYLHDDLLRIPYSLAISLCRKAGQSA